MDAQTAGGSLAGLGMLSSLFGGISQYKEGQAEKSAYDYNADVTLQNMDAQMQASQQKYSQLVGKQASAYARAGVDVASGSPLLMMAATAGRGGAEGEQIEQAGTEEATLQQYYGKLAAWKGTIGGVSDFLSGMTSSLSSYYKMNPPVASSSSGGGGSPGWAGPDAGDSGGPVIA